jgi:uncharacterized protein
VDFSRRAVALAEEVARPDHRLQHTIQTNCTLPTDKWCELQGAKGSFVGISIDGPQEMHARYRVDTHGGPTLGKLLRVLAMR